MKNYNSFLDKKFVESLLINQVEIRKKDIRLVHGSIINPKPAVEGRKMKLAVKGRPAIPATHTSPAIPSIQPSPAVPAIVLQPAEPGGQWFHVSTVSYETMKEILARLVTHSIYPVKDLQLKSEFATPHRYHQYNVGYFSYAPQVFKYIYSKEKWG